MQDTVGVTPAGLQQMNAITGVFLVGELLTTGEKCARRSDTLVEVTTVQRCPWTDGATVLANSRVGSLVWAQTGGQQIVLFLRLLIQQIILVLRLRTQTGGQQIVLFISLCPSGYVDATMPIISAPVDLRPTRLCNGGLWRKLGLLEPRRTGIKSNSIWSSDLFATTDSSKISNSISTICLQLDTIGMPRDG